MASKRKSIVDVEVPVINETVETEPIDTTAPETLTEKQSEQQRQKLEFRWNEQIKAINKKLLNTDLSSFTLAGLDKELTTLFDSFGIVKGKQLVDENTKIQLINGVDTSDLTLGELMKFVKAKAGNDEYTHTGFAFQRLVILKFNENPYLHPLAKSLNIDTISEDYLEENSFMTKEAFDFLSKGFLMEQEFGLWNTNIEKAHKDLTKYKKVRKLIYRDGKAFITTVYESNLKEIKTETPIKLEDHPDIHTHAKDELSEGDLVSFVDKDGDIKTGKIVKLSYGSTDKFGKADILLDDGKTKISKSLKLVRKATDSPKKEVVADKVEEPEFFKPLKLSDLHGSASLGGSSDAKLMIDKNGKKWVVKKARTKDGKIINGQLEQEVLSDNLYRIMGINSPYGSYLIKEGDTVYKIAAFYEDHKNLGAVSSEKRQEYYDKVKDGFVMDAFLGNWDVIGAGKDNIILADKEYGGVCRIDNGGALEYRAKGRKKTDEDFGPEIKELTTFLDSDKNPVTAEVYKGITNDQIKKQAEKIIANRDKIESLVETFEKAYPDHKGLKSKIHKRLEWLDKNIVNKKEAPPSPEEIKKTKLEDYDKKYPSKATADYFKDWDKFEMEGNPEIKEGIKKQILKIEKENERKYQRLADSHGISIQEYKIKLQEHVEKVVGESEYFRATDIKILDLILTDHGRYKSQFEVGKSHGSYTPSGRASAEYKYFAFKDKVDHEKENRPIYGYCSSNTNGVNNYNGSIPPGSVADHYGEVTVKIKKEVALKKATVTFGDSLGRTDTFAATPGNKPHFTSFDVSYQDPLKDVKNTCKLDYYTEVQYHNQLGFKDIESVHMSTLGHEYDTETLYKNINKMIEIGRKTNVKIVIFGDK